MAKELLMSEFPQQTKQEWIEKIEKDLKGKSYETLYWEISESLKLPPLAMKENLKSLPHLQDDFSKKLLSSITTSWLINEQFHLKNKPIDELNEAFAGDVNAFEFILETTDEVENLRAILLYIDKDEFRSKIKRIAIIASNSILKQIVENESIINFVKKHPKVEFLFGFDFLSELALTTEMTVPMSYVSILKEKFAEHKNVRYLLVKANYFHNAAASVEQELANALSIASAYITFFERPEDIVSRIDFLFSIGSFYFVEIAKLRVFRLLWSKLIDSYGSDFDAFEQIRISAITSEWNKTIFDAYLNMLRNTTESMSAVIGGADTLTVLPFDYFYEQPNSFSRRIARNVHHILAKEAHLSAVDDPAKGAYYIEILTHQLGERVWTMFSEIEKNGGFEQYCKTGELKKSIEANASKVIEAFNSRKRVLVGVNNYPNLSEEMLSLVKNLLSDDSDEDTKELKQFRLAEEIEKIRLENERHFSKKPKVFLFTYGDVTMRRARAGFVLNFLGCAGFEIIDNLGFDTIDEGIDAYRNSGADVLAVCGADNEYVTFVPALFKQVDGVKIIAGNPKKDKDMLKQAGADYFIYTGVDILRILNDISKKLSEKKVNI